MVSFLLGFIIGVLTSIILMLKIKENEEDKK
jgi:hypothetical protein